MMNHTFSYFIVTRVKQKSSKHKGWLTFLHTLPQALCALSTEVIFKGLTLQRIVFDVCVYMYMLFYVCVGINLVDGLQQSFEMYICLRLNLIVLGGPCVVNEMLKSNYYHISAHNTINSINRPKPQTN